MALGGTIKRGQQTVEAKLLLAYAGGTRFAVTRWKYCHHRWWVLDYLYMANSQLQCPDYLIGLCLPCLCSRAK